MTTQSQCTLSQIFDAFCEYVNECLMFDTPSEDIADFGEWAHQHYGISPTKAEEFLCENAA